ncbi:MAG: hypothetical protein ACTH31_13250 [Pseudoclavibacter sp.]
MTTYAKNTEVTVERSRAELEKTLGRYGATHFGYLSEPGSAVIAFRLGARQVRFSLPLPDRNDREFTHHSRGARTASAAESECAASNATSSNRTLSIWHRTSAARAADLCRRDCVTTTGRPQWNPQSRASMGLGGTS